ncbi:MAG: hypothetical protein IK144_08595 [Bacteroidaceae bacterium]|nr:hypothetical protein [Bacteroidaceae bacterium]
MTDKLEIIKQKQLVSLKPIKFIVNEVCDCLVKKQEVAAFTLTNYLFEASLKTTLIYWESGGKHIEDLKDFENLYRKGTKKYLGKDLYKVIEAAKCSNLITPEERESLLLFLNHFRNPFSHASNNAEISSSMIESFDESMSSKEISVSGNPILYFDYQERYMRRRAYHYFMELYSYILKWDKMISELRHRNDNK